jgi:hypothetical protein
MGLNLTEINYSPTMPERLFVLFLFIAICIILVRVIKLAWRLWSFRSKRDFIADGTSSADEIAKAVLRGMFKIDSPIIQDKSISIVDSVETIFMYLWEISHTKVQSMKTMAWLTIILSLGVAALGSINICTGFTTEETAGIAAGAASAREVFRLLASGLFVSAFFYALSLLFEGTLACRRIDWSYLRAKLKDESCSNP